MTPLETDTDIWFSCGCRDWRITVGDEQGVEVQPPETEIDHECRNLIVYRKKYGINRYFRYLE
jgi:hypothetical protein